MWTRLMSFVGTIKSGMVTMDPNVGTVASICDSNVATTQAEPYLLRRSYGQPKLWGSPYFPIPIPSPYLLVEE